MKRVLIAVDGSAGSSEATRQIGQLLTPGHHEVALYYSPPGTRFPAGAEPLPEIREKARQMLATAVFDDAAARLPEAVRAGVHRIVGTQPPRVGVLTAAKEWHADLIVVGARGVSPVKELLLGSVSHAIVCESPVPVYVARTLPGRETARPWRVLVAWEGDEHNPETQEVVGSLTWPANTRAQLIHVIEPLFAGELPDWLEKMARDADSEPMAQAWVREHDAIKAQTRSQLEQQRLAYPAVFHAGEPIVAEGSPADQILKAAAREDVDLIVTCARRMGTLQRVLLGSTTEKILSLAKCSVLIVRQRENP